jgi:hypothetical protein
MRLAIPIVVLLCGCSAYATHPAEKTIDVLGKMKKKKFLQIVSFVFLVCCLISCSHGRTKTNPTLPTLKIGEYLGKKYIGSILQSKSPLKSGKNAAIHLIIVSQDNDRLILSPTYNFHEGGNTYTLNADGSLTSEALDVKPEHVTIKIVNPDEFKISIEDFHDEPFQYVGSASKWVASEVLVGTYVDRFDNRYTFKPDGSAEFPGKKFSYEMGLDHVMTPYDYIYGKSFMYAFTLHDTSLDLFEVQGENDENVSPTPKWRLKRVIDKTEKKS